jgi:hypothetical protein
MTPAEHYEQGYVRGFREGRHDNAYEQDFAYQAVDYERGYWAGFKAGIEARVAKVTS